MVPELLLLSSNRLIRFGRHEFVQLRILREAVFKGDDVSGAADQAAARRHIGDVPQLGFGNVQKPGQLLPIRRGLIQQNQKF